MIQQAKCFNALLLVFSFFPMVVSAGINDCQRLSIYISKITRGKAAYSLASRSEGEVAEIFAEAILEGLRLRRRSTVPTDNSPFSILVGARGNRIYYPPYNPFAVDAPLVVSVPRRNERTVWESTPERYRQTLLGVISNLFQEGFYDTLLAADDVMMNPLSEAISALEGRLISNSRYVSTAAPVRVGISPIRLLRRSVCGGNVFVCRHVNYSMAGFFAELGVPPERIRLSSGTATREGGGVGRHVWVEVQIEPDGPWIEFDGTPGFRSQLVHSTPDVRRIGARATSSEESRRVRYPYDTEDYQDLFRVP